MYLTFEEKEELFDLYKDEDILKYDVSNGKVNYKYNGRVLIRDLNRKTANGYICGKFLEESKYDKDSRGWINIKGFDKKNLKDLLEEAMISFLVYL
ncbi:hypothetical protein [Wukongibacter sp. M2B1]|uniref:hypothetical protein n=1 Tax=Wukongibacter sp. M2B1 TaxID=3088895 RepID=UPI003D79AF9F